MNTEALILFLVLLVGMLSFSYQGYRMLYDHEVLGSPRFLAGSARQSATKLKNANTANARRAIERFNDDGGNQFLSADNEVIKQREKRCPVCEKKYPEEDNYCGDDGATLEDVRCSDLTESASSA